MRRHSPLKDWYLSGNVGRGVQDREGNAFTCLKMKTTWICEEKKDTSPVVFRGVAPSRGMISEGQVKSDLVED